MAAKVTELVAEVLVPIEEILARLAGSTQPSVFQGAAEELAATMPAAVSKDWAGRVSLSPIDAERLFQRLLRDRAQQLEEIDGRVVAAAAARLASIPQGISMDGVPAGVTATELMVMSDRPRSRRRQSPLEHALENSGVPVFHPIREDAP